MEKTVFSTKSIVFDAGENLTRRATQMFVHSHCCFFSQAMNRISAVLAHRVDKNQASFPIPLHNNVRETRARNTQPQCSTKHPRNSCPPCACFPQHSSGHPRKTFQLLVSVPYRFTIPPAQHVPSHSRVLKNVPQNTRVLWCSVLERSIVHPFQFFMSQLRTAAYISQHHLPSGFPAWPATTYCHASRPTTPRLKTDWIFCFPHFDFFTFRRFRGRRRHYRCRCTGQRALVQRRLRG